MKVNLASLNIDQNVSIEYFVRAFQEGDDLQAMRNSLTGSAIIKRYGDTIFGFQLSENEANNLNFIRKIEPIVAIDSRFINNLLRKAISDKAAAIGFRQVGSDKYEKRDEIAFAVGDDKELVAKAKWLLRPFSLPDDNKITYTLLINPRLSYRFKYSFAYLAQYGFNWKDFGNKVRARDGDDTESDLEWWEQAHTTIVLNENGDQNTLTCEFRDKSSQDVQISNCWPLANTENRYFYLRRRYAGMKGSQFAKSMETLANQFFSLKTIHQSVTKLIQDINPLKTNNLLVSLTGLSNLSLISKELAHELQTKMSTDKAEAQSRLDDIIEEDDEPDEYTQLDLF